MNFFFFLSAITFHALKIEVTFVRYVGVTFRSHQLLFFLLSFFSRYQPMKRRVQRDVRVDFSVKTRFLSSGGQVEERVALDKKKI